MGCSAEQLKSGQSRQARGRRRGDPASPQAAVRCKTRRGGGVSGVAEDGERKVSELERGGRALDLEELSVGDRVGTGRRRASRTRIGDGDSCSDDEGGGWRWSETEVWCGGDLPERQIWARRGGSAIWVVGD